MANVLLAEDNRAVVRLVEYTLEKAGIEVEAVGDGWSAIDAITLSPPDLAILDILLPGLDGLQVLEQIRGELDAPDLPVIILSSLGDEEHVVKGIRAGANDYIVKPFRMLELVARVERLLND